MKLAKAIEILSQERDYGEGWSEPDFVDATKLSIEALNEVKRLRSHKSFHVLKRLPGETEE